MRTIQAKVFSYGSRLNLCSHCSSGEAVLHHRPVLLPQADPHLTYVNHCHCFLQQQLRKCRMLPGADDLWRNVCARRMPCRLTGRVRGRGWGDAAVHPMEKMRPMRRGPLQRDGGEETERSRSWSRSQLTAVALVYSSKCQCQATK